MCASCAEKRGSDLGGKAEKNWNGLPTSVRRSFENKLDRESGSGFSRAGRSYIDMHFLLISAADPIQISDCDIPNTMFTC